MADRIEEAALAFEKDMAPSPPVRQGKTPSDEHLPPTQSLFDNVGNLEVDQESPDRGGGDELDPEELIYGKKGKPEARARDTGKKDGGPREGDDDGADDDDGPADGDDEPEEEADEDEPDPEVDAILNRKVEITVDGEPAEVTLKEAIEGYVRTETFHRRMNQLDEAKKIVRRAAADAVQNYEYSMNVAKQMEEHMKTMIPPEPDWDAEFQKDPAKARELQRYYEKANTFRTKLQSEMAEAGKKMAESNQTQLAAFAEEESQKFEQMNRKNWADPKRKAKDLTSMRKTGLSSGFSEQELSEVYDSRMLNVLLKASKYDRMMAAKPKPVVRQPAKPIPPGTGSAQQRTVQRGVSSAMKKLNRSGSIEDAAVVFDQIIARG